ncbi:MAG: exodeoxyribonuclease VII small subunit [Firmicutes bacterium]|nr:exodeoxyribonuclease VII small subunit [Bacillota bacterium]
MAETKEYTFEGAVSRLEEIVRSLEGGKTPLDEALRLYEEGVSLVRLCCDRLDTAEQKVKLLKLDGNGGAVETDFAPKTDGGSGT